MEEKLPTPRELKDMLGDKTYDSVAYGDSRLIRNYMNKPVVAYGIGFAGFVCIIKSKTNVLKGYSYGQKNPSSNWSYGGFNETDTKTIMETINNNKFIVKKGIDKKEFENGKLKYSLYERPTLASFTLLSKYSWSDAWSETRFRLVRLRSKKIRAEETTYWGDKKFRRCYLNTFINTYEKVKDNAEEERKMKDVDVPEDILDEVKSQILVEEI